ncbi:hypothetical protein ACFT5D_30175 [Streptomyces sp. NPDC057144]|uniref:hypothetical protein n=1 Tax=Streptomyces sp. NPDC057144 TaxID=3346034 RepID=UPI0036250A26
MKSTRLERRAEKLCLATGLPWADALKRVKALPPGSSLIPEAHPSQALLESYVLSGLAWPNVETRHSWGIRSTDGNTDSLVLTFENDVPQHVGCETMASELVRALVPRFDEHSEVHGIPGARFTTDDAGIHVRRVGLPGSLRILGIPPEDWNSALDRQRQEDEGDGQRFCHEHSPHRWHRSEAPFRTPDTGSILGRHHYRKQPSAWLASGLLRRAPLFRTIGVPLSTTAWTNLTDDGGTEWIIEYINEPADDASCYHQGFTSLLTDLECGLPIAGTDVDCYCGNSAGYYCGCRFYARSSIGQPGALQVRFSHRSGDRAQRYKDSLDDYEARRRIFRRIPAHLASRGADTSPRP